jgi:hypothetical protein
VGIFGRLFFSGKLPEPLRAELEAEGVVLLEEDLRGTITYRNYRAPGRRYGLRKARIAGAIAVTRQRIVAWGMGGRQVDVPLGHPGIEVARDGEEKVVFAYDASAFHANRSGRVEVRLRTPSAARIVELYATPRIGSRIA